MTRKAAEMSRFRAKPTPAKNFRTAPKSHRPLRDFASRTMKSRVKRSRLSPNSTRTCRQRELSGGIGSWWSECEQGRHRRPAAGKYFRPWSAALRLSEIEDLGRKPNDGRRRSGLDRADPPHTRSQPGRGKGACTRLDPKGIPPRSAQDQDPPFTGRTQATGGGQEDPVHGEIRPGAGITRIGLFPWTAPLHLFRDCCTLR